MRVLNTLFPISYAGFFAKSQIMFFSSVIIPILPTAQEWRHEWIAFRCGIECLFGEEEKDINRKPSPDTGKVAALAVRRGKCEQKRKNKKISMSKTNKKYSDLCTQACPYRLAKLGTSLRVRGEAND